eukprot:1179418-Prorocentrum_minimum.AAC.3
MYLPLLLPAQLLTRRLPQWPPVSAQWCADAPPPAHSGVGPPPVHLPESMAPWHPTHKMQLNETCLPIHNVAVIHTTAVACSHVSRLAFTLRRHHEWVSRPSEINSDAPCSSVAYAYA